MHISRIYNYIYIMYSHGWISGYQCNPHIVDASCGKPSNKPSRTSPEMDGIQLLGSHIVNSNQYHQSYQSYHHFVDGYRPYKYWFTLW